MILEDITLTNEAEAFLEDLAHELEIPESRYEQARERYRSLGEWFHREGSTIKEHDPQIYAQGSFRLGTAIRPPNEDEDEDYDVDSICLCKALGKGSMSQKQLKELVGAEIEKYRLDRRMQKELTDGRRCWVLSYADGAQFHMDIVPAVPNGDEQLERLSKANLSIDRAETTVAITDKETPGYEVITDAWPRSNPKGYSKWFKECAATVLERRQRLTKAQVRAEVENIPTFRLKSPLQSAVMILKRHRDNMFADDRTDAPISIIITTLAAHAYGGEDKIGAALTSILAKMDQHILVGPSEEALIPNPSDPFENFADKWVAHPQRAAEFQRWLATARQDFAALARMTDRSRMTEVAADSVGQTLAKRAEGRRTLARPGLLTGAFVRDEAQARREAVRIHGDTRSA